MGWYLRRAGDADNFNLSVVGLKLLYGIGYLSFQRLPKILYFRLSAKLSDFGHSQVVFGFWMNLGIRYWYLQISLDLKFLRYTKVT